ncbi:MAG: HDOD domain-containing protein, partial [Desulfosarcinaceae bacterium]
MIFKGDLSKYHPADAMMFLSQAGVDGVLSVADRDCIIVLTFKGGRLMDAQSVAGDRKLMRFLRHDRSLNDQQVRQIQRIQRETGLSVRQILGKLDFFPLVDVQDRLKSAMQEVLHQLFLLDQGGFNFTETQVEDDGAGIRMDLAKACLGITPRADEYRDFFKSILAQDRLVKVNDGVQPPDQLTLSEQLVLNLAGRNLSVKELLEKAPVPSFEALMHLQQFLDLGVVSLGAPLKPLSRPPASVLDPLFSAYKRALKSLLSGDGVLAQLEAMISFGKLYYDNLLILTARNGVFIHCKTIRLDPESGLVQKSTKGELGRVDDDPVFSTVDRSGIAFFGKVFPCKLLDSFAGHSPNGECALIPMHRHSDLSIFLYACTEKTFSGLSPHHYLELLSWIVTPALRPSPSMADKPNETPRKHQSDAAPAMPALTAEQAEDEEKHIAKMVGRIKDLPPLPIWVSQVLKMLSQPETPLEEIEALVGKDQALVAKLVQVANSALYGGMQKITTLRQVLTRLGLKT